MWKMKPEEAEYEMKLLSSLEKVFPDETPVYRPECLKLSGFWGETVSFQAAYKGTYLMRQRFRPEVVSPIREHVHVRSVELVPVEKATNGIVDDYYLKTESGMYPDLLREIKDGMVIVPAGKWRSLWVDVELDDTIVPDTYEIEIRLLLEDKVMCASKMKIEVIGAHLPKQEIMHTEWFHADCLADYYQVEVFSEAHWKLLEKISVKNAESSIMRCPICFPSGAPSMRRRWSRKWMEKRRKSLAGTLRRWENTQDFSMRFFRGSSNT